MGTVGRGGGGIVGENTEGRGEVRMEVGGQGRDSQEKYLIDSRIERIGSERSLPAPMVLCRIIR